MKKRNLIILGLILILILLIYICYNSRKEGFTNNKKCPDVLTNENGKIALKFSGEKEIPGMNPKEFNNLEEYKEYLRWQRENGIFCPVLTFEGVQSNEPKGISSITKLLSTSDGVIMPSKMSYSVRDHPNYNSLHAVPNFNSDMFTGFQRDDRKNYTSLDKLYSIQQSNRQQQNLFNRLKKKQEENSGLTVHQPANLSIINDYYDGSMEDRLMRDSGIIGGNFNLDNMNQDYFREPELTDKEKTEMNEVEKETYDTIMEKQEELKEKIKEIKKKEGQIQEEKEGTEGTSNDEKEEDDKVLKYLEMELGKLKKEAGDLEIDITGLTSDYEAMKERGDSNTLQQGELERNIKELESNLMNLENVNQINDNEYCGWVKKNNEVQCLPTEKGITNWLRLELTDCSINTITDDIDTGKFRENCYPKMSNKCNGLELDGSEIVDDNNSIETKMATLGCDKASKPMRDCPANGIVHTLDDGTIYNWPGGKGKIKHGVTGVTFNCSEIPRENLNGTYTFDCSDGEIKNLQWNCLECNNDILSFISTNMETMDTFIVEYIIKQLDAIKDGICPKPIKKVYGEGEDSELSDDDLDKLKEIFSQFVGHGKAVIADWMDQESVDKVPRQEIQKIIGTPITEWSVSKAEWSNIDKSIKVLNMSEGVKCEHLNYETPTLEQCGEIYTKLAAADKILPSDGVIPTWDESQEFDFVEPNNNAIKYIKDLAASEDPPRTLTDEQAKLEFPDLIKKEIEEDPINLFFKMPTNCYGVTGTGGKMQDLMAYKQSDDFKEGANGMPIKEYKSDLKTYMNSLGWNSYPLDWFKESALETVADDNTFNEGSGPLKTLYDGIDASSELEKKSNLLVTLDDIIMQHNSWFQPGNVGDFKLICKDPNA